jgi:hypothetical protein
MVGVIMEGKVRMGMVARIAWLRLAIQLKAKYTLAHHPAQFSNGQTLGVSIVIASGAKQSTSYNGREWIASSLRSSQ